MEYLTKLDLAERALIRAIASGEIAPGEALRQGELAKHLGISATPVREALRRLEERGIVVRDPHRGVRVAEVEPSEMLELYLIRASLEGLAVERATPNVDAKVLRILERQHERLCRAREQGATGKMSSLNYDLHTTLYHSSNMPRLTRIIDSLWLAFPWDSIWAIPGRAEGSELEHASILAAVKEGDAKAAGDAMRRHIQSGGDSLVAFHRGAVESL